MVHSTKNNSTMDKVRQLTEQLRSGAISIQGYIAKRDKIERSLISYKAVILFLITGVATSCNKEVAVRDLSTNIIHTVEVPKQLAVGDTIVTCYDSAAETHKYENTSILYMNSVKGVIVRSDD